MFALTDDPAPVRSLVAGDSQSAKETEPSVRLANLVYQSRLSPNLAPQDRFPGPLHRIYGIAPECR